MALPSGISCGVNSGITGSGATDFTLQPRMREMVSEILKHATVVFRG